MVVLLASEDKKLRRTIGDALRGQTSHTVIEAVSVKAMESAASSGIDLLLFSPAFDTPEGKAARQTLRSRFPRMQTVRLDESDPAMVLAFVRQMHGEQAAGGESLPVRLGDYELRQRLRSTPTTHIYRAWQCSVNREVAVEKLRPELREDTECLRMFRRMVRARAQINHPHIASVFDAEETEDSLHYARELIRGRNMAEMAADGTRLPQETVLQLLRAAAEAALHLDEKGLPRDRLTPEDVFLGPDGLPRVANLAAAMPAADASDTADIQILASAAQRLLPAGPAGRDLAHVVGLMKSNGQHAAATWKAVARETRFALQRLSEARTSLLGDSRDAETARRRRKHTRIFVILLLAGIAAGSVAWYVIRSNRLNPRDFSMMVRIPAGDAVIGDGEKLRIGEFWIDQYEVSIGQYAAFLDTLPHGPPGRFDHPDQPTAKSGHKPGDWDEIFRAARDGGTWKQHQVTMNSPVFNVDWWDAAAYARWKGRRLPTGKEWERAARGTEGLTFPWGNQFVSGKANTGEDYSNSPAGGGGKDGYSWWCDVDAFPGDVSPDGVMGMAGNVAEWTQDWAPHPDFPDRRVPVFRGGDFRQNAVSAAKPWIAPEPVWSQPYVGFRTASDSAP